MNRLLILICETILIEELGLKVPKKDVSDYEDPEELQIKFEEQPELEEAFKALTPGRQKGYLLHFSLPKQSKTRTSRIEKLIPKIMEGKGFHDR